MRAESPTGAAAALDRFSEPTRAWFRASFAAPTAAQVGAWEATAAGGSVLVSAPTGSGKTLAAFLAALDRLLTGPAAPATGPARTRVVYVSPLKALAYDVDRNLRAPLTGITQAAQRLGVAVAPVAVALRSGDTPADERRRMARAAPDILVTTPESLFLLLTSRARETLAGVETVIVDEVHAVASTKRGAHLAVTLERLEALVVASGRAAPLQRVGLSATQRPLSEVAAFLAGGVVGTDGAWTQRPMAVVDVGARKPLDVEIVVPVEDMSRLGEPLDEPATGPAAAAGELRRSIWPAVHPRILDLVRAHRSTIVFANSRRLAERLCARLNELAAEDFDGDGAPPDVARAHHGSVAREQRLGIESDLKAGRLRCVVATSSLELGIDMGAVDLVVQVESPGSVASGLQRIGRAGHQVGAASVGKVFPKYRGDLVECAVVVRRMHDGDVEQTRYPRNPLDVLAQQVVAMAAMDPWRVADLAATVRGAASFADLSRTQLDGVLDMLSGRYPSDEFAELRPRVTWDRVEDRITGRAGAQRLAVTSGGTIPDRGLYGVFVAGDGPGRRVGELDEEMVYETRPGETFTLGSSTWRIVDITRDQVLVTPAPGEPGKLPFWHGDAPGRPVEVGRAVGAFVREVGGLPADEGTALLESRYGLDRLAAANLVRYLADQREATATLPTDRAIVVERFRDEIGDWRVCVLSPFGARVHAPWALAIEARARERLGMAVQTMYADDGIVVRLPEADELAGSPRDLVLIDPDDLEDLVVAQLADSALFAARFRECAARALLLPRRRPGGRTPLWQQRQRAADLLAVASRYGGFPILLETYRECLRDVFDVPALTAVLRDVAARRVRVVEVETPAASPFASSLLFDYVASYLYEGDAPLAERRAQALSLDRELLAELVGADELRELVDPVALDQLEAELQRLAEDRRVRAPTPSTTCCARSATCDSTRWSPAPTPTPTPWTAGSPSWNGRVGSTACGSRASSAGRPPRTPPASATASACRRRPDCPTPSSRRSTARWSTSSRYARTHGPFLAGEVAARLGLPRDAVELALKELDRERRVVAGGFRPLPAPAGAPEWCDAEVLRRLRRRSLAVLRREIEPVEGDALGRFLPAWHGVGAPAAGPDRALEVVAQLQGAPVPASVLEGSVLARGCATPGRRWTRCAPPARWCGSGAGRWDPATGGWRCTCATRRRCSPPFPATRPRSRGGATATPRCSTGSAGAAPRSGRRCTRRPAGATSRGCSTRCGTSSGRATSPTTATRRCAPSAVVPRGGWRTPAPRPGRDPRRSAARRGALVARRRPRHTGRVRDRAGGGARRPAARPPRRRDARRGRSRGRRRRLQRRVRGAQGDGGVGALPPRLLRRGARRGAVRAARSGRPAARRARGPARPRRRGAGRARGHRPGEPVRRGAGVAGRRRDGRWQRTAGGAGWRGRRIGWRLGWRVGWSAPSAPGRRRHGRARRRPRRPLRRARRPFAGHPVRRHRRPGRSRGCAGGGGGRRPRAGPAAAPGRRHGPWRPARRGAVARRRLRRPPPGPRPAARRRDVGSGRCDRVGGRREVVACRGRHDLPGRAHPARRDRRCARDRGVDDRRAGPCRGPPAAGRPDARGGGAARQAPAPPFRPEWAGAALPHGDDGLVAPVRRGATLAQAGAGGAARAGGARLGVGVLLRAGRRAVVAGRGRPPSGADVAGTRRPRRRHRPCRGPPAPGRTRRLDLGEALLDQRVLAGVGNVYKCEVLFLLGLDPWTRVADVPAATRDELLASAERLLKANVAPGAGPIRTTTRASRDDRRRGDRLAVYGRAGRPCRRCATPVRVAAQGEQARLTFWCPGCQGRGPDRLSAPSRRRRWLSAGADAPRIYRALLASARVVFRLLRTRLVVACAEHVAVSGPVVVAANHVSYYDPVALAVALEQRGRAARYLAKRELFDQALLRFLLCRALQIPVDRRGDARAALRFAERALRDGQLVAIFPEGTIHPRFAAGNVKTGAARLALAAGAPLVPAAVDGTQRLRAGGRWRRGVSVTVRFGAPVAVAPDDAPAVVTARLATAITELLDAGQPAPR